jgi:DNA-binding MarR family transcriptional regulator
MSQNLGFTFQQLAFSLLQKSDNMLQNHYLIGYAQYKLLEVLSEHPHSSQRFVAMRLGQSEASVSRQIKLMQRKGLLRVGIPSEDRRARVVSLSTKGTELQIAAAEMLNTIYGREFSRLNEQEQLMFSRTLRKLVSGL